MYSHVGPSGHSISSDHSYSQRIGAPADLGAGGGSSSGRRSESTRNPLGHLIEHRFAEATSSCRSYSELERRSGVSREALSRYITSRSDRRRSPTVETLAAIATALNMNIEILCRAAAMRGPARLDMEAIGNSRSEQTAPLLGQLTEEQFHALLAFLRQMLEAPGR
ncbi:MAG TPA: helix-turn-helix transcriptional regulator [Ktedonobacterales bacterium]